jgi:hypothetical protein
MATSGEPTKYLDFSLQVLPKDSILVSVLADSFTVNTEALVLVQQKPSTQVGAGLLYCPKLGTNLSEMGKSVCV